MTRILMVVAQKDFRDEELFEPEEVFKESGYDVDVASITTNTTTGMLGGSVTPNLAVKDAKVYEYDAIVIVGGKGSPSLIQHKEVLDLVRNANDRHKIITAICLGPMTLAAAGVLKGRKATVFETRNSVELFQKEGVRYVKEAVVVDGRFITANGPSAARDFGKTVAGMLI